MQPHRLRAGGQRLRLAELSVAQIHRIANDRQRQTPQVQTNLIGPARLGNRLQQRPRLRVLVIADLIMIAIGIIAVGER